MLAALRVSSAEVLSRLCDRGNPGEIRRLRFAQFAVRTIGDGKREVMGSEGIRPCPLLHGLAVFSPGTIIRSGDGGKIR